MHRGRLCAGSNFPESTAGEASDNPPRRASQLPFRVVVVAARSLLDGSVLRLLHGFDEGDATAGGFGEVAGAQSVRGKQVRIDGMLT